MSATDLKNLAWGGFVPVIDVIMRREGVVAAQVFGVVWRFCQFKSGKCFASHNKIADFAGLSRTTVKRALKALVYEGYLSCESINGETNVYIDTGLAGRVTWDAEKEFNDFAEKMNTDETVDEFVSRIPRDVLEKKYIELTLEKKRPQRDPGLSDPGLSDPGLSDPGLSDLGLSDPGLSDLGLSDLGLSGPPPGPERSRAGSERPPNIEENRESKKLSAEKPGGTAAARPAYGGAADAAPALAESLPPALQQGEELNPPLPQERHYRPDTVGGIFETLSLSAPERLRDASVVAIDSEPVDDLGEQLSPKAGDDPETLLWKAKLRAIRAKEPIPQTYEEAGISPPNAHPEKTVSPNAHPEKTFSPDPLPVDELEYVPIDEEDDYEPNTLIKKTVGQLNVYHLIRDERDNLERLYPGVNLDKARDVQKAINARARWFLKTKMMEIRGPSQAFKKEMIFAANLMARFSPWEAVQCYKWCEGNWLGGFDLGLVWSKIAWFVGSDNYQPLVDPRTREGFDELPTYQQDKMVKEYEDNMRGMAC